MAPGGLATTPTRCPQALCMWPERLPPITAMHTECRLHGPGVYLSRPRPLLLLLPLLLALLP
jgi:hypothetical protein